MNSVDLALVDRALSELKKTKFGWPADDQPTGHMANVNAALEKLRANIVGAYMNPFRHTEILSLERTDQGVDVRFKQGSRIEAMGPSVVTRATQTSGWPLGGCVQYRITAGDHEGEEIYHAESIVPGVRVGDILAAGDFVAHVGVQGWTESGFIQPGTNEPCSTDTSGKATAPGKAYARWLRQLGFHTKDDPGPGTTHGCK